MWKVGSPPPYLVFSIDPPLPSTSLYVDDYTPAEEAPRDNYDNRGPPSPRGGDDMPPRGGRGDRYANRYESAPRRDARPQLPVPDRAPFIAFVGNLSFSATDDDTGHFFAEHCAVDSVRLIRDPSTGRSKGFGYVTFADRESLVTALEANDVEVCGRPIHVDVAEGRQSEDRRMYLPASFLVCRSSSAVG